MDENTVAAIADLASARTVTINAGVKQSVGILPDGYRIQDLEKLQEERNRVRETILVHTPQALAAYLNRFAPLAAGAFVDFDTRVVQVVLDYPTKENALFGHHVVNYEARMSPEFIELKAMHNKPVAQADLGEFIEDHLWAFKAPEPASLMEMVMNFQTITKVSFKSRRDLTTGRQEILYAEEDGSEKRMQLPKKITMSMPVFRGLPARDVDVHLRTRCKDGGLTFTLKIADLDKMLEAEFARAFEVFIAGLQHEGKGGMTVMDGKAPRSTSAQNES